MKKLNILFILLLISFATTTYSQDDRILIKEGKQRTSVLADSVDLSELPGYRNPTTAFVLSFFITGAGQFYNGDIGKGVAQILFVSSGVALIVYDSNRRGSHYGGSGINFARFTGYGMILGGVLWSVIDAPVTANKNNKNLKRVSPYGHFIEFESGQQIVGIDLGFDGNSLGGRITLHF